jgi:dolichyl-phosphate-mannose-protein mannosyltransferase
VEVPPQRLGPAPPEVVAGGQQVIHREEKIEYRDAQGNILKPDQVEELKGKVKFEVRTRPFDPSINLVHRAN